MITVKVQHKSLLKLQESWNSTNFAVSKWSSCSAGKSNPNDSKLGCILESPFPNFFHLPIKKEG